MEIIQKKDKQLFLEKEKNLIPSHVPYFSKPVPFTPEKELISPKKPIFLKPIRRGEPSFTELLPSHKPSFIKDDPISERAKILASTLNIPYSLAYDTEEVLSKEMEAFDNKWVQTAKNNFKIGIGNALVNAGRALEWAGLGGSISESVIQEGTKLQYAYAPLYKKEEFDWANMLDPYWWATTVAQNLPTWGGLLLAGLLSFWGGATAAGALGLGAFSKVLIGSIAAGPTQRIIESALEAAQTYDEQLQLGKSRKEAKKRADYTFEKNLMLMGLDIGEFALSFLPLDRFGLGKTVAARIAAVTAKFVGVPAMEAAEEIYQEAIQQAARGEKPHWGSEMKEAAALGMVFGLGIAGAGSVWNVFDSKLKSGMPPDVAKVFNETINLEKALGATPEAAQAKAYDAIAELPEGKAYIESVIKDIDEKIKKGWESQIEIPEEEISNVVETEFKPQITDQEITEFIEAQEPLDVIDNFDVPEEAQVEKTERFIVSREAYERSRAAISEKLKGLKTGIDPTIIPHMAVVGAYHIEQGIRNFAKWSNQMIEEFGEAIKPHLRKIWKQSNAYLEEKVPEKEVKGLVRKTTGQIKLSDVIREDKALHDALKMVQENAKIAYKQGELDAIEKARKEFDEVLLMAKVKADILGYKRGMKVGSKLATEDLKRIFKEQTEVMEERRKAIVKYIQENLPIEMRGKYLNAVISKLTPKKTEKLYERVAEQKKILTKKELIEEIEEIKQMKGDIAVKFQYEIKKVLGDIQTKKISQKTISRLQGLKDYIEEQGIPSGISTADVQKLSLLDMVQAHDMTEDQLRNLVETGKKLTHLGKLYAKLENLHNERERKANLNRLLESTTNLDPKISDEKSMMSRIKYGLSYGYMETLQVPRAFDRIDGYKNYQGEHAKIAKNLMFKEAKVLLKINSILNSFLDELSQIGLTEVTPEQKVRIMINIRYLEGAYDQVNTLMEHYGYADIPVLTPEESKIIELLEKYVNSDLPQLIATYEKMTGNIFPKIPKYILPLKYADEFFVTAPEELLHTRGRTTHTERGMTYERKPNVNRLPSIEIFDIFEHAINTVQWYINMEPELQNIKSLVLTKEYAEKAGQLNYEYMRDYLDVVARRGWSANARFNWFSSMLRAARGNLTVAVLGYKFSSSLLQVFAVFDAMAYAQASYGTPAALKMLQEVTRSFINPQLAKEILEKSPLLETRMAGEVAYQELMQNIGISQSLRNRLIKGGMVPLTWMDFKTAAGVESAFKKILEEHGVPNAQEEAEFLMTLVSSSSLVTFRPLVLSRGEMARTLFHFQNFFLNRWGEVAHDLVSAGILHGDWKGKYRAILGLAILAGAKIAEDEAKKYLYELITGKEIPDVESTFKRVVFAIPSNIPFFGNLFDIAMWSGGGGLMDFPVARAGAKLARIFDIFFKEEASQKVKGALAAAESFISLYYGVPGTAQAFDVLERILVPEESANKKPKYIKPKQKKPKMGGD